MSNFLVVAFYTVGTPYADLVETFTKDCEHHSLDHRIIGYPTQNSWVRNAGLKPIFLRSILQQTRKNILYLDIDARVRQYPKIIDNLDADIGVHYRNDKELLSGTIYLRNCDAIRNLLEDWVALQQQYPDTWDQKNLQLLLTDTKLRVAKLPASYTQIFDTMKHHGQPVIEHFQASRKFKKMIHSHTKVVGKVRIRTGVDGCRYISRHDDAAIKYLDTIATRYQNQLKWYPVLAHPSSLEPLRNVFDGRKCYIIGKGPSLDHLNASYFLDTQAPVIGINEAVHTVTELDIPNPVFGLQQDAALKDRCYPSRGRMFVSIKAASFYADKEIHVFDARDYGLNLNSLSVSAAIEIVKTLGGTSFELLCFDSCVTKNLEYAKCIGYDSSWGGVKKRFLTHRPKIESRTKGYPLIFTTPTVQTVASSDRLQQ